MLVFIYLIFVIYLFICLIIYFADLTRNDLEFLDMISAKRKMQQWDILTSNHKASLWFVYALETVQVSI